MKKTKGFITLLLTLTMILAMGQAVSARDTQMNGGTYTYNGSAIVTTNASSIQSAIAGLEPGDSITITQTYTNNSDKTTEWYLKNDVVDTFERRSEEGGYTYRLTSGGQVIFDSDRVGGNGAPSGSEKGLQLATDATGDWIHIDKLAANASGTTTLYVALDGESQANAYQTSNAEIDLQYAVEDEAVGEDVIKHVSNGVNTGDRNNIAFSVAAFIGALLLLILAIVSYRKDRKDGEEA